MIFSGAYLPLCGVEDEMENPTATEGGVVGTVLVPGISLSSNTAEFVGLAQ